jgi:hypothetical protein
LPAQPPAPSATLRADTPAPAMPSPQDLENTTGAWDMYGQDSDKRYNALQVILPLPRQPEAPAAEARGGLPRGMEAAKEEGEGWKNKGGKAR